MRVWFETNTTVVRASIIVTVILSVPLPISLLTLGYDESYWHSMRTLQVSHAPSTSSTRYCTDVLEYSSTLKDTVSRSTYAYCIRVTPYCVLCIQKISLLHTMISSHGDNSWKNASNTCEREPFQKPNPFSHTHKK